MMVNTAIDTIPVHALPDVSIIVCVYNEAGNGAPLVAQIRQAMQEIRYELIYVNDGSTDNTLAELRGIDDSNLIVLDLKKNYGQSLALAAGIDLARGAYVVTLDGDQQNDPADIMRLLKHCDANELDLVAGLRSDRQDGYLLRKLPSNLANALIRWATGMPLRDLGCGLKVFRASMAKSLNLYGELHRFILVMAHMEGARMAQLPVNHRARQIGHSKYGLSRTLRVVSDLLLLIFLKKYRTKPMHLFGTTGVLMIITSLFLFGGMLLVNRAQLVSLLIAGLILAVGGLQLLAFGIMTELQLRTHFESQGKKPYEIRKAYKKGFNTERKEALVPTVHAE
ncbi:glycosyltransferase family 2 protein [Spirosoma utsteinense]|uniref:Glycosyltransferase involved in cell wall biosynthesis n=1 Tax=Spirosoma utsteinense TaxID=2585773 RepID=A0ABR6W8X8_9BACT|nr:glycosyltransferase family 2 protein [Spirosoma utsteinense]MBC3787423.1 glycosyltransferase involved in cell wall biosynthesis [Spirosoma utsteinense]MBC3793021.1 glycosyltransferase involved in cell wall biosynthesis [Spirosoma utsteinense]